MSIREQLQQWLNEAEAIVIGGGAGLSTSAGFEYGGTTFMNHFQYMHDLYGYHDMYTAGFHTFDKPESYWAYWSKFIYLNRYNQESLPLYDKLLELIQDKNYFVITTNVDHQFQKAGFDKKRLFYTQGDYGLFQCSKPCHNKTYDNEDQIKKMIQNIKDYKIPTQLLPKCPFCHSPMVPNLRCDERFVEDEGWMEAKDRYLDFINKNKKKKILFLELGVGWNTPGIIKYPFIQMTYQFSDARYVCINKGENIIPKEIRNRSIVISEDINEILNQL